MRQAPEPFAKDGLDLRGTELMRDPLDPGGVLTRPNAIVERLVGDAAPRELAFEPLVPIQTQLGGIRKVRTERDEEGAEVAIDEVEVVVIGASPSTSIIGVAPASFFGDTVGRRPNV